MGDNTEKLQKKQLFHARIQSLCLIVMAVGVIGAFIRVNGVVTSFEQQIGKLTETVAAVDVDSLNSTVTSLHEAADKLASVDVDTMNKAIESLRAASDSLSKFDVEGINNIIDGINKTMDKLQATVDSISGITGLFGGFR